MNGWERLRWFCIGGGVACVAVFGYLFVAVPEIPTPELLIPLAAAAAGFIGQSVAGAVGARRADERED